MFFSHASRRDSLVKNIFLFGEEKVSDSEPFLLQKGKCLAGAATLRGGYEENKGNFGRGLSLSLNMSGSDIF